ncbi:MAG: hypothetical protein HOJ61_01020 [Gammaproteobacteria bacterium]|nr:hypothetical protein [Gammaproteobacteria bacterium]MBT5600789.1 hypothetical protein [Gammaproteobacteria bacterium]MBT6244484.1 hypothetical protein [Gammaproteobacteria bacterium]
MIRMPYLLMLPLITIFTVGCSSTSAEHDYTINQTGMVACKFASEATMPTTVQHEDLVYGDGTVQSRSQAHNGIGDCYEKLEK